MMMQTKNPYMSSLDNTIESLAQQIDQGLHDGTYSTWAQAWEYHKTTFGTLSIQMSIPTGQVVAEVLDAIESMENY
jgi:hypothetical protein